MKKEVRILLVGEPGVGKTSLILSLVSEEFPEEVPPRAEEITIPAEVTPEKVPTHIVDFSWREQDEAELLVELERCDVVCIVYSVMESCTIERLSSYWLPLVRRVTARPIILVGNKSDAMDASSMEIIAPVMNSFKEVETCVECSAKTLKNISEVFYYAQKAVLHPTAPLYLPEEGELSTRCRQALARVFRICDQDNDGLLNDHEIFTFQRRCFNVPLQPQALEDVKHVIRKHLSEGVVPGGVTLPGFLFLHTLFIQRGRHETTWTVLRKFGYDDELQLQTEYLYPNLKVPYGSTTELSADGYDFFAQLFDRYDEDQDGCLSPTELTNLFSVCPSAPWGPDVANTVQTNAQGWMTRAGFLAQWTLTTYLDPSVTLEYLAHLGYMYEQDNLLTAIRVTRAQRHDIPKRQVSRRVLLSHVIGPKGIGKTTFLQGLLGRNLKYLATLNPSHFPHYTINTVYVYGQETYLLLHEVNQLQPGAAFSPELACDVACLVYDVTNPKSFEYCARTYKQHFQDGETPVLIVGTCAEQKAVVQDYSIQPAEFCRRHGLPPPQLVSAVNRISTDVYVTLTTMAAYPNLVRGKEHNGGFWLKMGLSMAAIGGLSFVVYKYVIPRLKSQRPALNRGYGMF